MIALVRWWRRLDADGADRGSAVVEFLGVTLLLLVPLVYLVLTLGRVQAAAFATEGAAREAGRIVAQAETMADATARGRAAVELALADQGFAVDGAAALTATCTADPCLTPGARVVVEVRSEVDLPLVPDVLARAVPVAVPVHATHVAVVGEFRETER
ncbi:pilus assembly protein [Georgenia sp. TF02-10]|uniref:pilus assembly protein n=1 Tax=Georgenia sp. TF02-10 TaxID=2917725 RepID=UPI001FA7AC85|nr:pilus assembly protein [Georgenia sp. TF02-10]UNX54151.1 pilus assembly protein [Georgenia sp. TF02-10]